MTGSDGLPGTSPEPGFPGPPPGGPAPLVTTAPVPLRQARRTHPLSIVFEMVAVLFGVLLLVLTVDADWLLAASLASSVFGLGAVVLRWWFRMYTVTGDRLLLDEGVLQRRHRVVPYARVQQVNVTQELFHRPFSLAALNVETAGEGGSSSISLRVLRRADAEALRSFVLDRRQVLAHGPASEGVAEGAGPPEPGGTTPPGFAVERLLGRMAPDDLILAGLTHSAVFGVVVAFFLLAVPAIAVVAGGGTPLASGLQALAVLTLGVVVMALIAAAISMTGSLVRDWNWTLMEQGDDLHVRRGLLEVRSQSLPRRRVQQVTVVDNPIRRKLGIVSVALHTAAMPGSQQATMVVVPLVRRSELDAFLTALMGPAWVLPPLQPRSEAARWRAIRRRALLLAVVCVVPAIWRPDVLWVLLPLVLLAWPWGQTAHRRAGLAVTDDRVVFASGVLHHRIDVAPRRRIQSCKTSSSPLQRRAGLATLHADLAGTTWRGPLRLSARLFDVDGDLAARLRRSLPRWDPSDASGTGL